MIIEPLLWVSLVLGGLAGCLWFWEALRGNWLQVARVPVRGRRPVRQWDQGSSLSLVSGDRIGPYPREGPLSGSLHHHLVQGKRKRA